MLFSGSRGNLNWDRQYRLKAGESGGAGFEIGGGDRPLHISFAIERTDLVSANSAKISIWNLNDAHRAIIEKEDCVVSLFAGYGMSMPELFTGVVTFACTKEDGADLMTQLELQDSYINTRDSYVSVGYWDTVDVKTLIKNAAKSVNLPVSFSYNSAPLVDKQVVGGYSFVGQASDLISNACKISGADWCINNGVIQVKKPNDTMHRNAIRIAPETGLIGRPVRVKLADTYGTADTWLGWDIEFLMSMPLTIDDYVFLDSKVVRGYFRVYSISVTGDNMKGSWTCSARLLEAED